MIDGIAIDVDIEAVVVHAERPLRAVSSATVGGGLTEARALVNLHVPKGFRGPVGELGWLVARTVRSALDAGAARWVAEH